MSISEQLFKVEDVNSLFQIKNFASWKSFINYLMENSFQKEILWRGQADANWEIVSAYTRECEAEIKKMFEQGMQHQDEKIFQIRHHKAFHINRDYQDLLFNSPHGIHEKTINTVQSLLNPIIFRSHTFDEYQKNLAYFSNLHYGDMDELYIQKIGSSYDFTFCIDIDLMKWAWGQHYGVKTPLVDWTNSVFFALFFALCTENHSESIAIYSLNTNLLGNLNESSIPRHLSHFQDFAKDLENIDGWYKYFLTFFEGLPITMILDKDSFCHGLQQMFSFLSDMRKLKILGCDLDDHTNTRLNAQSAFFTFAPGGISVEEWCRRYIQAYQDNITCTFGMPVLVKHIIPMSESDKRDCMRFLETANISFKTVYPDFQGISKYLNQKSMDKRGVL